MKNKVEVIASNVDGSSFISESFRKFNSKVTEYVRKKAIDNPDKEYSVKEYSKDGVETMVWSKSVGRFFS